MYLLLCTTLSEMIDTTLMAVRSVCHEMVSLALLMMETEEAEHLISANTEMLNDKLWSYYLLSKPKAKLTFWQKAEPAHYAKLS